MLLAKELGTRSLLVKSDSLLVTGQVTREYQTKDLQLALYLREQNSGVDLLSKLASSRKGGRQRSVIQETLKLPRTAEEEPAEVSPVEILGVDTTETWITPYQRYLADGLLPAEPIEAKAVKRNAGKYTLIDGKLFHHGYTHPILTCVSGDQYTRIMEELHEGICGSHVGGKALSLKVIRTRYYWPTMKEDCVNAQ
ncbi:uncharacterized protein [Phaseolus vulgaris]|uniref:uncharacterized protein n=1 Tax=Phaseolus vulgaris TaxID=3885 RepID=UPI0035CC97A2